MLQKLNLNDSIDFNDYNTDKYIEDFVFAGIVIMTGQKPEQYFVDAVCKHLTNKENNKNKVFQQLVDDLFDTIQPICDSECWYDKSFVENFYRYFQVITGEFSTIIRLRNRKTYKYYSRKTACEICSKYHENVMNVKDALKIISKYVTAAKTKDVELIKSSSTFVVNSKKKSVIPPLHIGCGCRVLADLG